MNSYIFLSRLRPLALSSALKNLSTGEQHILKCLPPTQFIQKSHIYCASYQTNLPKKNVLARSYSSTARAAVPHGDNHGKLWITERIFAIGTAAGLILIFIYPGENIECMAALAISLHSYWGLEAIYADYVRPSVVGTFLPKCRLFVCTFFASLLLVPLLWCAIYGNGIVKTIQQIWYLDMGRNPYPEEEEEEEE